MEDVLVATLTVQNSHSMFQVTFEFGECTLQTQMMDHMSTLLNNFADSLLSFGHRKGGKYANCGANELQKFKEEVIQKYLGVPKERFGNSPRESDLEAEDLPGVVPMAPPRPRSRLSDRRCSIPDLTAPRTDPSSLDLKAEQIPLSRQTSPQESTGATGVTKTPSTASDGSATPRTHVPSPAPTAPGTAGAGLTQRFWNYFRKKETSESSSQPGRKVESSETNCFVLPRTTEEPVPGSGVDGSSETKRQLKSPWR